MRYNMAFGAVFEPDIGNSVCKQMNCHRPLARRSCSKDRYVDQMTLIFAQLVSTGSDYEIKVSR